MKLLDRYFAIQQETYEYFGYEEGALVLPLDDRRESYWQLHEAEDGAPVVISSEEPFTPEMLAEGRYYEDLLLTSERLPQAVYRGKDYTMIAVDPQMDGNLFLAIYANDKEQHFKIEHHFTV